MFVVGRWHKDMQNTICDHKKLKSYRIYGTHILGLRRDNLAKPQFILHSVCEYLHPFCPRVHYANSSREVKS